MLTATLTKISSYKQLIFNIRYEDYIKLKPTADENCTWVWDAASEDNDDELDPKEDLRYYCKINLDRFDKAIVEKKFTSFVKQAVKVSYQVETFTDKQDKKHTYFRLTALRLAKRPVQKTVE
jgi:UPF0288 family protein (methanogenesis marker protein 3)